MRYLILFLFLFSTAWSQQRVAPNYKPGSLIYNANLVGDASGTFTDAFSVRNTLGYTSVFFLGDSSGFDSPSDSCLTYGLALKDNDTNVWSVYYTSSSTSYSRLDTLPRALINTPGTLGVYISLGGLAQHQTADSAKLWMNIAFGDTLSLKVSYGSH